MPCVLTVSHPEAHNAPLLLIGDVVIDHFLHCIVTGFLFCFFFCINKIDILRL